MGDLFDHPELVIVAGIHDLLYLPLKLRPGVDNAVVDQVVYRDPQNIGDVDQRGQADPGRSSFNVAHGVLCPLEVCQNPKYQHENVHKPRSAPSGEDCGFLRPTQKRKEKAYA